MQVDKDLKKLSQRFQAKISKIDFDHFQELQVYEQKLGPEETKKALGLARKPRTLVFKEADYQNRIYPNSFAPVIVWQDGERVIKPMRYRVRPSGSVAEVPSKYNVFNARVDSLEKRQTWKNLFLSQHALFPFIGFYEWVEDAEQKKRLIRFHPENKELMWAPALYDQWSSKDGQIQFNSFALITDEPPPEVHAQGHDRCPIFLAEKDINMWLQADKLNKDSAYKVLQHKESVHYAHQFTA